MSISRAMVILALLCSPAAGQRQEAPHKFWNRKTIAFLALDGVAKGFDAYQTHAGLEWHQGHCQDLPNGERVCTYPWRNQEGDPIARPFVHSTRGQVGYSATSLALDASIAYLWHRAAHHRLERWTFIVGASQSVACGSTWFGMGHR